MSFSYSDPTSYVFLPTRALSAYSGIPRMLPQLSELRPQCSKASRASVNSCWTQTRLHHGLANRSITCSKCCPFNGFPRILTSLNGVPLTISSRTSTASSPPLAASQSQACISVALRYMCLMNETCELCSSMEDWSIEIASIHTTFSTEASLRYRRAASKLKVTGHWIPCSEIGLVISGSPQV